MSPLRQRSTILESIAARKMRILFRVSHDIGIRYLHSNQSVNPHRKYLCVTADVEKRTHFAYVDSVIYLAVNRTVTSLPVFIKNILMCVPKTIKAFTGLERHGVSD